MLWRARKLKKTNLKFILLVSALLFLSACETVGYYSQSVVGHSKLMLARQPIDKAINRLDGKRKNLLVVAKSLRLFATNELSLPDNGSYLSYVNLKREHPVWSVVAAPEFSVTPISWCYPVIGCASYRGYFSEKSALNYAKKMQKKGYEIEIGGVTAYSTLGWFRDPLIPNMLDRGDIFLAEVMFHELAHQQLYIKGNSAFNEAFATVVGEQGTLRWLALNHPEKIDAYRLRMQVRNDFSKLIKVLKERLKIVYAKPITEEVMREQKTMTINLFKQEYEQVKQQRWSGKPWYGGWLKKSVNNARMASFSTYRDLVPQFEALLGACENNFERFYQVVAQQKGQAKAAQIATTCD